ncbi:pyridoxal phosphate-dependent aminotransferase [Streptomyces sp. NPDC053048]|uniref:pyridoxal phosphate-dependent aminotransferase n=1 Tax=Streptomyces sp. NPDC053048 TaxID=3365694 RepID=UPI0037CFE148
MVSHSQDDTARQRVAGRTPAEVIALLARTADPEQRLAVQQQLYPDLVNLATAENVLLYSRMNEKVFSRLRRIEVQDIRYPVPIYGTQPMREDIAELLRPRFGADLDSEDVFCAAGVSGALECLAFALKKTGAVATHDPVLIPAPFWQGFKWCFEQRPELTCVPVRLETKGLENFELTLEDIQRAYYSAPQAQRPKLLVLTNPHNPLGVNYDKGLLEKIYTWALTATDMHIISDEMYAHSQIETSRLPFVSAFALDAYRDIPAARERVHVVWGFAKDFGLSGFKAGVILTRSPEVKDVLAGKYGEPFSWFSPFNSLSNLVIGSLLETLDTDRSFALELMDDYRGVLTDAFHSARQALDDNHIPYVFHDGQNPAQFFWLDLRQYLDPQAPEIPYEQGPHFPRHGNGHHANGNGSAPKPGDLRLPVLFSEISSPEENLSRYIQEHAHVQLLPGQTLSAPTPGYFRLCYTAFDKDKIHDAINRIGLALKSRHAGDDR